MPDRLQRCALPGCDAPIKQANGGGPRQKFCCAAHRVAARRLRHDDATTDPADKGVRLAPLQLNIGEQAAPRTPKAPSGKVAAATAAAKAYRQQVAAAASRRKRAIAVLAAATVLTGGGGVVAFKQLGQQPPAPELAAITTDVPVSATTPPPTPEPAPTAVPDGTPREAPTAVPNAPPREAPTAVPNAPPREAPTAVPDAPPREAPTVYRPAPEYAPTRIPAATA